MKKKTRKKIVELLARDGTVEVPGLGSLFYNAPNNYFVKLYPPLMREVEDLKEVIAAEKRSQRTT